MFSRNKSSAKQLPHIDTTSSSTQQHSSSLPLSSTSSTTTTAAPQPPLPRRHPSRQSSAISPTVTSTPSRPVPPPPTLPPMVPSKSFLEMRFSGDFRRSGPLDRNNSRNHNHHHHPSDTQPIVQLQHLGQMDHEEEEEDDGDNGFYKELSDKERFSHEAEKRESRQHHLEHQQEKQKQNWSGLSEKDSAGQGTVAGAVTVGTAAGEAVSVPEDAATAPPPPPLLPSKKTFYSKNGASTTTTDENDHWASPRSKTGTPLFLEKFLARHPRIRRHRRRFAALIFTLFFLLLLAIILPAVLFSRKYGDGGDGISGGGGGGNGGGKKGSGIDYGDGESATEEELEEQNRGVARPPMNRSEALGWTRQGVGRATFYDPTIKDSRGKFVMGACEFKYINSVQDMIAALNKPDFGDYARQRDSPACGQCIRIQGPNGTIEVQVVDMCPGCKSGDVDLSPGAFAQIALLDKGRVPITWQRC